MDLSFFLDWNDRCDQDKNPSDEIIVAHVDTLVAQTLSIAIVSCRLARVFQPNTTPSLTLEVFHWAVYY